MKRRGRIPYNSEEMEWLEANYRLVISDYHAAFVTAFGRSDVTAVHLNQLRKRKGWKVGRDGARYRGRIKAYSPAEMDWLRSNSTLAIAEFHAGFQAVFSRPEVTQQKLHALRKRQRWTTGRTGHFEKGAAPMNKGTKCAPGRGGRHPNAQRTQFKKGQLPHNAKYLGHERVSTDGYVEISVDQPNPHTGFERTYVLKHKWLWEQLHGPVPDGHALKCLDSNPLNTDPSNWEPVPRAVLARLNGGRFRKTLAYDDAEPELKPLVMATAKLKHRAHQVVRDRLTTGSEVKR